MTMRICILALATACAGSRAAVHDTPQEIESIELLRGDRMGAATRRLLRDSTRAAQARWQRARPQTYDLRVVAENCGSIDVQVGRPQFERAVFRIVNDTIAG